MSNPSLRFPVRARLVRSGTIPTKAPERPLPSLARRAVNFAGAVGRQVVGAAKGEKWNRPTAEAEANHAICMKCPKGLYRAIDDTCTHPKCGCPMKRKSAWSLTRCPEGFWGPAAPQPKV